MRNYWKAALLTFLLISTACWYYALVNPPVETVCQQAGYFGAILHATPFRREYCGVRSSQQVLPCPLTCKILVNASGTRRVFRGCWPSDNARQVAWMVLLTVQAWYYRQANLSYRKMPPLAASCRSSDAANPMELVYPSHQLRLIIPREMDGNRGKIIFRAGRDDPTRTIHWHLNNCYLGRYPSDGLTARNRKPPAHPG